MAEEGDSFSAGTDKIKHYSLNQNGVTIEIWDTPAEMVETFSMHEWDPDLTLFCFRMDGTRFPTRLHSDTIKKLTELFGKSFGTIHFLCLHLPTMSVNFVLQMKNLRNSFQTELLFLKKQCKKHCRKK